MIGANGIYASVEKTNCKLCGQDAGGYKLCEECRDYTKAMDNCYPVDAEGRPLFHEAKEKIEA